MKKLLSGLLFGLFLFSGICYAQDQPTPEIKAKKPHFWYGPKAGVDLFRPTINQDEILIQLQSNYQVGFFLQFGRKFYIQPEFYYAVQKEKSESLLNSEVTINTLKVPLMFGMRLINLKVISAHIMAGPSASIFLSESVSDPAQSRQKNNFTLQGGGGIDLLGFITMDVRYSVDMNNSMNDQIKQLSWGSGVNVTLGLKLR